jgi:MSHA biogenesis protein MshN
MSLVNKMLRDLDARRAGESDRAALPAAVTPLAARQEPGRGLSPIWFGIALAVVGVGAAAWYGMRSPAPEPEVAMPVAAAPASSPASLPVVESVEPIRAQASVSKEKPAPVSLRMADALSATPVNGSAQPRKAAAVAPKAPEPPPAVAAPPRQSVVALPRVPVTAPEARIDKQVRLPSPAERAELEYRRGVQAQRQGKVEDAAASYRVALEDYPEHAAARQVLAALLIEVKHYDDAEELLRKGTELAPVRLASALALARLKVERNQALAALEILLKHAAAGEGSAEYQGFAGALLNRAGRVPEAVERYKAATRLAPSEGRWWAALGIALEASGKSLEAREAYLKARSLPGLPADLAQHIEHRLR